MGPQPLGHSGDGSDRDSAGSSRKESLFCLVPRSSALSRSGPHSAPQAKHPSSSLPGWTRLSPTPSVSGAPLLCLESPLPSEASLLRLPQSPSWLTGQPIFPFLLATRTLLSLRVSAERGKRKDLLLFLRGAAVHLHTPCHATRVLLARDETEGPLRASHTADF